MSDLLVTGSGPTSWVETLRLSRSVPACFLTKGPEMHLAAAVGDPCRHLWELNVFDGAIGGHVTVSPRQYFSVFNCGSVNQVLLPYLEMQRLDNLVQGLSSLRHLVRHDPGALRFVWSGARSLSLAWFAMPLVYAEWGFLAIRWDASLWGQTFHRGWPTSPPQECPGHEQIGLVLGAALTDEWFPGLPFRLDAARDAVPPAAAKAVSVSWHEQDDLLPDGGPGSWSVLEAANVGGWL